ncbi:hypothetical protein [Microlunatus spumicola]|uniref:hypothetical protein n=1 Tax=Microlunatus spumicola TaxID=81499 RepID=UPI0019567EEA
MRTSGRTTSLRTETRDEVEAADVRRVDAFVPDRDDESDEGRDAFEEWECEEPEPVTAFVVFFTVLDTWSNVPLNPLSACAAPDVTARLAAPAARTSPARRTHRRRPAPAASRDPSRRRHP